eukprot:CAMPEP_0179005812 /NCGR_PEP_ID=MMETSP0795-20121207/14177_1 /TAXON_ID=88552 /ORGANISM="Amoebophrya sp., Strain Ameob2" /LENGTH=1063 /DNA_ID=CAMNT_0020700445 /DNA_START=72 /DNA_END=3263 /DNA_ORIENTATION=-
MIYGGQRVLEIPEKMRVRSRLCAGEKYEKESTRASSSEEETSPQSLASSETSSRPFQQHLPAASQLHRGKKFSTHADGVLDRLFSQDAFDADVEQEEEGTATAAPEGGSYNSRHCRGAEKVAPTLAARQPQADLLSEFVREQLSYPNFRVSAHEVKTLFLLRKAMKAVEQRVELKQLGGEDTSRTINAHNRRPRREIRSAGPGFRVFGSAVNGFRGKNSDVDVSWELANFVDRDFALKLLHDELQQMQIDARIATARDNGNLSSTASASKVVQVSTRDKDNDDYAYELELRPSRRNPILILENRTFDGAALQVEVSVRNTCGVMNSWVLREMMATTSSFSATGTMSEDAGKHLGLLVKHWVRNLCRIPGAGARGLSSYSVILMVLHFLGERKERDEQEHLDLPHLFAGFLDFYAGFDFRSEMVCVRDQLPWVGGRRRSSTRASRGRSRSSLGGFLYVRDPLLDRNVAEMCSWEHFCQLQRGIVHAQKNLDHVVTEIMRSGGTGTGGGSGGGVHVPPPGTDTSEEWYHRVYDLFFEPPSRQPGALVDIRHLQQFFRAEKDERRTRIQGGKNVEDAPHPGQMNAVCSASEYTVATGCHSVLGRRANAVATRSSATSNEAIPSLTSSSGYTIATDSSTVSLPPLELEKFRVLPTAAVEKEEIRVDVEHRVNREAGFHSEEDYTTPKNGCKKNSGGTPAADVEEEGGSQAQAQGQSCCRLLSSGYSIATDSCSSFSQTTNSAKSSPGSCEDFSPLQMQVPQEDDSLTMVNRERNPPLPPQPPLKMVAETPHYWKTGSSHCNTNPFFDPAARGGDNPSPSPWLQTALFATDAWAQVYPPKIEEAHQTDACGEEQTPPADTYVVPAEASIRDTRTESPQCLRVEVGASSCGDSPFELCCQGDRLDRFVTWHKWYSVGDVFSGIPLSGPFPSRTGMNKKQFAPLRETYVVEFGVAFRRGRSLGNSTLEIGVEVPELGVRCPIAFFGNKPEEAQLSAEAEDGNNISREQFFVLEVDPVRGTARLNGGEGVKFMLCESDNCNYRGAVRTAPYVVASHAAAGAPARLRLVRRR